MKKSKKDFPEDFRTSFAFSTMMWPVAAATMLFSNFFMLYLTDYSGIDSALGRTGFAAALGTVLLLVARIVDIVDDPLQAWIVDNSKDGRLGKYRKYAFINIILVSVAMICIFSIPEAIKKNSVLLCIWVGLFYLVYEMGVAFSTTMPLLQKTTYDTKLRSKLMLLMRIWVIVIMAPVYFSISIITFVDRAIGNIGKSFSLVFIVLMAVLAVISFIGVIFLKENPEPKKSGSEQDDDKLKLKEVLSMFIKNKPLLVHSGATFINIVFTLVTAMAIYFIKWYYAADVTTGVVDATRYADIYSLFALSGLIPNFVSPFLSGKLIKKTRTYAKATTSCLLVCIILYVILAVMFFAGILRISPYIFIAFNFVSSIVLGAAVIPQTLLWTECADYAEYKTGKKMSAMVNAVSNIIGKAQAALAAVMTGAILVAVGYSVNNETGNYAGNVAELPRMINGFGFIMTVVPIFVMLIAYLMYKFMYPITPAIQEEMVSALAAKRDTESGAE